jgi:hypothetical protein
MRDVDKIINDLGNDFIFDKCPAVDYLYTKTNFSYEYGISYADFYNEYYEDCIYLSRKWLETLDNKVIDVWYTDEIENVKYQIKHNTLGELLTKLLINRSLIRGEDNGQENT